MSAGKSQRAQSKVRRILLLVDTLAPFRYWHDTARIGQLVSDRLGEVVSKRTIERDLHLLQSLGMAESQWAISNRGRQHTRCLQWRVVLNRSESIQRAALRLHG